MAKKTTSVYLAGPISGEGYTEATNWRNDITEKLRPIECFSPLRFKSYLDKGTTIRDQYDKVLDGPDFVLSTQKGIMTRDYFDCNRADLIFVNLLGAKKVSIGTAMEIAWAYSLHKPVVVAMEDEGNIHEHAMLKEAIGFRVTTLEQAVKVTRAILLTP